MYLSRLILNPRSRRVQRELAEPYQMHRSVMSAFPSDLDPGAERVLFRVDDHPSLSVPVLLVQSRQLPDWSCLADDGGHGYLLPVSDPNPAIKPIALSPVSGELLTFRLRANPTIKKSHENQSNGQGRRHALVREEDQRMWLDRKAEKGGFRVKAVSVVIEGYTGNTTHGGTKDGLNLFAVRFDGVLEVTDASLFVGAVESGIGSAKGFGFGLLSLAPVR